MEHAQGGWAPFRALACDYDGTLAEHDKIAVSTLGSMRADGRRAPTDALPEAKARVDWILPGAAGDAVRHAIDERILGGSLPPPRSGRQRLHLGWTLGTSEPVEIPARGVNVLVQGDSLCGKSSLVGGLVERLAAAHDSVCMPDPEGDYELLVRLATARLIDVATAPRGPTARSWRRPPASRISLPPLAMFRRPR
jgi:hypothetical protein